MTSFFNSVPIDNTDPNYLYIEKQVKRNLPKELSGNLELVGSFGKKPQGSLHHDIDFLLMDNSLNLQKVLSELNHKYYQNNNPYCYSLLLPDSQGIIRKVDIFKSDCIEFSYSAFYVPMWYQTSYPYNILPLLINFLCKIHFKQMDVLVEYSPSFGVKFNDEVQIDSWKELQQSLGLGTLERVEDILENVKHKWNDFQKSQLSRSMIFSTDIKNLLERENCELREILQRIDHAI